jgi:two-component system chemotaxis response regulator CheY
MAYNILIVDDSQTVRAVIRKTLDLAGIEVGEIHEAGNGQEALDVLGKHWLDLVFADINMPVSTEGSSTRVEQLKAKGVSAYVRKPFTPEIIRSVVEEVLGGRQHEA